MNTEEFIETMVTIDYHEEAKEFGHHPFQMASFDADNKLTIGALFLGGDVQAVYGSIKKMFNEGARKVHVSVDFGPMLDIKYDFVAVYTFDMDMPMEHALQCVTITYDKRNGNRLGMITEGAAIKQLKFQFLAAMIGKKLTFHHN